MTSSTATSSDRSASTAGAIYAIAAFGAWGLCPFYFKSVAHVGALEVLCHRVIWSLLFLLGLLVATRKLKALVRSIRTRNILLGLLASTVLIAINWFIFIWAIAHNQLTQASLGYFINPLVNVLLGFLLLGETQRRWQMVSIVIALIGVGYMTFSVGSVPWVALTLAFSFGFYGLVRKLVAVEAVVGLAIETAILLIPAIATAVYLDRTGRAAFGSGAMLTDWLLVAAGVVTAVPLLFFTAAARRLRLSTLGFIQYTAPTGQFLLAVLYYKEPFDNNKAISFGFIWIALAIYSWDTIRRSRRRSESRALAPIQIRRESVR